jgi:hypothetical protein
MISAAIGSAPATIAAVSAPAREGIDVPAFGAAVDSSSTRRSRSRRAESY